MEHLSTSNFRNLSTKNKENLKNLCNEWKKKLSDDSIPEEVRDEIRATVGLTNLLLSQKFKQFEGLIEDSELKRGEKEITCSDLQGFWDMVYNEVEKIQKSFSKLDKCQKNNWVFQEVADLKRLPTKSDQEFYVTEAAKRRVFAAQQRLMEAKLQMRARIARQKEERNDTAVEPNSISNLADQKNSNISTRINTPSEKISSSNHAAGKNEKENVLPQLVTETEKKVTYKATTKRGKAKEVIPLQCVTRSAMRAKRLKQADPKKD